MTQEQFITAYPQLYHMATSQSLPTIKKYGLLSTDAILELCEIEDHLAEQLRSSRRSTMTRLESNEQEVFFLRDQKPMRDAALSSCLDGMTIPEWYQTLNRRVFMWASRERVNKLLDARAYRKSDQLVLTIDTQKFAAQYFAEIEVSTLNSGATLYTPLRRGAQTFVKLSAFESKKAIVEVTVLGSVPNMYEFVDQAEVRKAT